MLMVMIIQDEFWTGTVFNIAMHPLMLDLFQK
jgi:hypothetical protein